MVQEKPQNGSSWLDIKTVNVSAGDSLVPAETNIYATSKTYTF